MKYAEVYSKLCYEVAIISFLKKDGTVRVMLGTRNLNTVSLKYGFQGAALGGHDNRCNINNGNLAVYDMILGEARCFNINRLIDVQWLGVISSEEQLNNVFEQYAKYKEDYESNSKASIDFEDINTGIGGIQQ